MSIEADVDVPAVEAHLRRQYAGVLDDAGIRRHLDEHVGSAFADAVIGHVVATGPARLLDVGAGYGSFVARARAAGIAAVGLEPARFETEVARDRTGVAPVVQASGAAVPYASAAFDAVTLWNVFEHVPPAARDALLDECVRVLRPGGRMFLLAPNYASFRREAHYHVWWLPLLPRALGAAYLRRLGRDPGFFVRDIHYCTPGTVRRALRRRDLRVENPLAAKLLHAEQVTDPRLRRAVELVDRVGLRGTVARLLAGLAVLPLRRTIYVVGVKGEA